MSATSIIKTRGNDYDPRAAVTSFPLEIPDHTLLRLRSYCVGHEWSENRMICEAIRVVMDISDVLPEQAKKMGDAKKRELCSRAKALRKEATALERRATKVPVEHLGFEAALASLRAALN